MTDPAKAKSAFDPLIQKHFSGKEVNALNSKKFDQDAITELWDGLISEARQLMKGDPASPEAQDLAKRWRDATELFTGGDPNVASKTKAVWDEAISDPVDTAGIPLDAEVFAFMDKATAQLDAGG